MKKKLLTATVILAAMSIVGAISFFIAFVRILKVPTGSMANTIIPGDRVLTSLWVGEIKRGDIIVFKFPNDQKIQYMQRVIGLPGETIQVRDTKVYINGQELSERRTKIEGDADDHQGLLKEVSTEGDGPYTVYYDADQAESESNIAAMKFGVSQPFQIPQGHYFILGDCRDNSLDGRFWGTVPGSLIVGKAVMIYVSYEENGMGHTGKLREGRAFIRLQ